MIKVTQTMYDKSCIDANKSVMAFFDRYWGENPHNTYGGYFLIKGVFEADTNIKLFRTKTRKDNRISFSGWKKWIKVGDTITLTIDNSDQIAVEVE